MAVNKQVERGLKGKVKKHNEEVKELSLSWNAKVTYKMLLEVFERGLGAYKSNPGSVRPSVNSPEQWAYARVNSFLYAMKKGKYQGGKHDTDLLPKAHPVRKKMDERALTDIDRKPTKGMVEEAEMGLAWRKEFGRGGTAVGIARARDIANGKNLSLSSIKRMFSFFSRHEVDKEAEGFRPGEEGYPSNGRIAWALWGGDPGFSWSTKKVNEIKKELKSSIMGSLADDVRHIKNIEETEDSYVVTFAKAHDREEDKPEMDEKDHVDGHNEDEKPIEEKPAEAPVMEDSDKDEFYNRKNLDPNLETRNFNLSNVEVREENGKNTVVGYGAVFNSESNNLGGFTEFIARDAFNGRENDDVRFLLNHDANYIMGRTTSQTLRLSVDDKGLRYEVDIPDTTAGRDLLVSLKRGDITQSSFAFIVEEDSWDQGEKGAIRTIKKVSRLYDVSAVTYPAYEEASVGLRSLNTYKEKLEEGVNKDKKENEAEELNSWNKSLAARKLKIVKLK
jgi:HK97 family phage prohead protease